jgi:serine/threonine protein kinase
VRRSPSQPPAIPGLRFERQLGAGGFSDVFLYEQQLPRRQVAVKVLLAEHLTEQTREAFVAEANLMAQLSAHPYIVTIYTADVAPDGRPYLAMEYCAGPSLAEQAKLRRFPVADALRTGVRLASAVATAHAAGILHRDIKPANVLTNAYGWPALTDFGISQAVELEVPSAVEGRPGDVGSTGASGTQTVGLSIPWSPPEMFEDEPRPDVRSDVFSLAATVYTLLAGRTPFEIPGQSNGAADLISRIERGTVTPLGRDDAPASLVATLQKGLAKDRANRFDSAVDFARALQRVEMELAYAPTPIDIPNLVQPPSQAPRQDTTGNPSDETRVRQVPSVDGGAVGRSARPTDPAVGTHRHRCLRFGTLRDDPSRPPRAGHDRTDDGPDGRRREARQAPPPDAVARGRWRRRARRRWDRRRHRLAGSRHRPEADGRGDRRTDPVERRPLAEGVRGEHQRGRQRRHLHLGQPGPAGRRQLHLPGDERRQGLAEGPDLDLRGRSQAERPWRAALHRGGDRPSGRHLTGPPRDVLTAVTSTRCRTSAAGTDTTTMDSKGSRR